MKILGLPAFSTKDVNPYNALLYEEIIKHEGVSVVDFSNRRLFGDQYDILHIHWPDLLINKEGLLPFLKAIVVMFLYVHVSRFKKAKLIWTVHNTDPHDSRRPVLNKKLLHWFAGHCHGLIFLSYASRDTFFKIYPLKNMPPYKIIPHGHYQSYYPKAIDQKVAREALGLPLDAKVFTFLGQIRAYKNVELLIEEFCALSDEKAYLVVAGSVNDAALEQRLVEKAKLNDNISLDLRFLDHSDLCAYSSATDYVVLPYKNIMNSGVAILALSYNRRVIVPNLGSMAELQEIAGRDWVYVYDGDISGDFLNAVMSDHKTYPAPSGGCDLSALSWERLAGMSVDLYKDVLQ